MTQGKEWQISGVGPILDDPNNNRDPDIRYGGPEPTDGQLMYVLSSHESRAFYRVPTWHVSAVVGVRLFYVKAAANTVEGRPRTYHLHDLGVPAFSPGGRDPWRAGGLYVPEIPTVHVHFYGGLKGYLMARTPETDLLVAALLTAQAQTAAADWRRRELEQSLKNIFGDVLKPPEAKKNG